MPPKSKFEKQPTNHQPSALAVPKKVKGEDETTLQLGDALTGMSSSSTSAAEPEARSEGCCDAAPAPSTPQLADFFSFAAAEISGGAARMCEGQQARSGGASCRLKICAVRVGGLWLMETMCTHMRVQHHSTRFCGGPSVVMTCARAEQGEVKRRGETMWEQQKSSRNDKGRDSILMSMQCDEELLGTLEQPFPRSRRSPQAAATAAAALRNIDMATGFEN